MRIKLTFIAFLYLFLFGCKDAVDRSSTSVTIDNKAQVKSNEHQPTAISDKIDTTEKEGEFIDSEYPNITHPDLLKKEVADSSDEKEEREVNISSPISKKETIQSSPKNKSVDQKLKSKIIMDSISFDSLYYIFDTIMSGDVVNHKFEFINKHSFPIEVKKTVPECGCTTPSFPFLPIESGEKAFIGVTFNSVGKIDDQDAVVHVYFKGLEEKVTLHMKGTVKDKKDGK